MRMQKSSKLLVDNLLKLYYISVSNSFQCLKESSFSSFPHNPTHFALPFAVAYGKHNGFST